MATVDLPINIFVYTCYPIIVVDYFIDNFILVTNTRRKCTMAPLVEDSTGNDLTFQIIGAAMAVHNAIGPGYKEEVYERSLAVELEERGIYSIRQYQLEISYADQQVALFYLDLLVEDLVVVEVKAFSHLLTNDERAQVINYLKASGSPVGLLFNFGRRKLEYKRIFPGKNIEPTIQRTGRDNVRKRNLPEM
jgi:GxxExxY protein